MSRAHGHNTATTGLLEHGIHERRPALAPTLNVEAGLNSNMPHVVAHRPTVELDKAMSHLRSIGHKVRST